MTNLIIVRFSLFLDYPNYDPSPTGKYATSQLVSKLPLLSVTAGTLERVNASSEETIRAILATLYEVFKLKDADSSEHARLAALHIRLSECNIVQQQIVGFLITNCLVFHVL